MHDQDYWDTYYGLSSRRHSERRIRLILQLYAGIGLIVATAAGVFLLLTLLPFTLSWEQLAAVIAAGVGALLALMSRTLITFSKQREAVAIERAEEIKKLASFLETWTRFEQVSQHTLMAEQDESDLFSFRTVTARLLEKGKIDEQDVITLEEGLKKRNLIVHGEHPMSPRITDREMHSIDEIITKIESPA